MATIDNTVDIVYRITKQLITSLDLDVVFGNVLRLTVEATGAERGSIFLLDESGQIIRHILARPDQSSETLQRNIKQIMSCGLAGWAYKHRIGTLVTNTITDERWTQLNGDKELTGSALVVPMLYNEQVNGILTLHQKQINFFDESHLALVTGIAGQAALALKNARLFEEIKTLAATDGMTSLYNYRYFKERLREEFERAKRYKRDISLIMVDIDFFKKYNDAHGHPKGDMLLKDFSGILQKALRDSDIIARYGGEEFAIILNETANDVAVEVAEKLRKAVELKDFEGGESQPGGRVTISLGVASYTDGMKSADDLVKNADIALYRAKEEGRNRLCA
jgi:diguanylate cyclase (GGDEF)-like protein